MNILIVVHLILGTLPTTVVDKDIMAPEVTSEKSQSPPPPPLPPKP